MSERGAKSGNKTGNKTGSKSGKKTGNNTSNRTGKKTGARTGAPEEPSFSAEDERWMARALALALRGRGMTRPNPIVGAVLVRKGRLLAEGFHRRAGLPHAEREALVAVAGKRAARGATLYVTLEPCCHTGRTPPCTDAIVAAGVERVVVGLQDPNPVVNGQGIARLRQAGIRVEVGCRSAEARSQNRPFLTWIEHGRPWVTLKVAATLDGFIADWSMTALATAATGPGAGAAPRREPGPVWLTGESARQAAHALRAEHDAVLVGAGTVLADDPRLTTRLRAHPAARKKQPASRPQPLRVVLDGRLRMAATAKVLRAETSGSPERSRGPGQNASRALASGNETHPVGGAPRTLIFASEMAPNRKVLALEAAGAQVVRLPGQGYRVPLSEVLQELARRNVQSVLIEGGAEVHGAFIAAGLVDAVAFFQAPLLLGSGVPIARGPGRGVPSALRLGPLDIQRFGADVCLRAEVIREAGDGAHSSAGSEAVFRADLAP